MPCRWDGDAVSRFDINLISYTYMCVYIYTHHREREIYIIIYSIYIHIEILDIDIVPVELCIPCWGRGLLGMVLRSIFIFLGGNGVEQ